MGGMGGEKKALVGFKGGHQWATLKAYLRHSQVALKSKLARARCAAENECFIPAGCGYKSRRR